MRERATRKKREEMAEKGRERKVSTKSRKITDQQDR